MGCAMKIRTEREKGCARCCEGQNCTCTLPHCFAAVLGGGCGGWGVADGESGNDTHGKNGRGGGELQQLGAGHLQVCRLQQPWWALASATTADPEQPCQRRAQLNVMKKRAEVG